MINNRFNLLFNETFESKYLIFKTIFFILFSITVGILLGIILSKKAKSKKERICLSQSAYISVPFGESYAAVLYSSSSAGGTWSI